MSKKMSVWEKIANKLNRNLIGKAPKSHRKRLLFIASGGKRGKK